MINELIIPRPDDMHLHLREGKMLKVVSQHSASQFGRAIIMPNLKNPIINTELAHIYYDEIKKHTKSHQFEPLMTIYFNEGLTLAELKKIKVSSKIIGIKLYPKGVTTNSSKGMDSFESGYKIFEIMQELDIPLLIHGEVNDVSVDIFDREKIFIEKHLSRVHKEFPKLRIVLEHISTKDSTEFVKESSNKIAATITPQHLLYNRNELFLGGLRPHAFCLPVLKREEHRVAVLDAAISGNPKFFLGTDSAPHKRAEKESSCGCAGIYSALNAMEIYAEIFDQNNAIEKLENFCSKFGAYFYKLNQSKEKLKLTRSRNKVPTVIKIDNDDIVPLMAGQEIGWNCSNI
ncbi:dihydroorotase [Methylophilaceae bacterium]|nr:dihydroorotase [Methylophilaceae bacterium]|tara:strand:- start:157 stop:1194 length:1038 start_codon:yes stop_codon:yes gene_type:complete